MAEGFEYFTSDDAGAPVLSAQRGRLIAVLDWVLAGKGGWDKVYTGTNLAAYRSQTGNRFYLRVDDTQIRYSRLRGYRTMTAVSTGTLPFPTTAVAAANTWGVNKGYMEGTAPRKYWGIRSDRFVMLFLEYMQEAGEDNQGINSHSMLCFGDLPSLADADGFCTLIGGAQDVHLQHMGDFFQGNRLPSDAFAGMSVYAPNFAFAASPDGTVAAPPAVVVAPFHSPNGMTAAAITNTAKSNRLFYSPYMVYSTNRADGMEGAYPRVVFPNFYQIFSPVSGVPHVNTPCTDREEFSLDGKDFLVLCEYNATTPANSRWSQAGLLQKNDTGMVL